MADEGLTNENEVELEVAEKEDVEELKKALAEEKAKAKDVKPENILALAFNEKAAEDLLNKITNIVGDIEDMQKL